MLSGPNLLRRLRFAYRAAWASIVLMAAGQSARPQPADYYVSLQGDDANPGSADQPWRHIEWAMTRPFLRGGDTIHIRGGVYRPASEPNPSSNSARDEVLIRPAASGEPGRPITVMAEPGETATLSGRFLAAGWNLLGQGSPIYYYDYATPLSFPFDHPFQIAEDGRLLYRAASLDSLNAPGRCFVDPGLQRIYIWTTDSGPPSQHVIDYGAAAAGIEFRGGVHDWRLTGFSVAGFKSSGIVIRSGAGSIEIDHMDISFIGAQRPGADPTSGYALAVYDTSGSNFIHENNLHHTLAEAVHVSQSGAGGDLFDNNDIHDAGGPDWAQEAGYGQRLVGPGFILRGNRETVRGNRMFRNGYHGLILESDLLGSEGPSAPGENIIEENTFAWNAGNGISFDGKNGAAPSRNNIIRFNLFHQNNQARAGSAMDAELRLAGNVSGAWIYNNTFYADRSNGLLLYAASVSAGTAQGADAAPSGIRILNNIAVEATTAPFLYPLRAVDPGPGFLADYNDWYRASGGSLASWRGTDLTSLGALRETTGQENHGLTADPQFVSAENGWFGLRAISPVIGRGLAEIRSSDFPAVSMAASPDLGAFAYRPLLNISPTELQFVTFFGAREPAPQTLEVLSAGPAPIRWNLRTAAPAWLGLSQSAGSTPAEVSVSVRPAGLGAGTYRPSIQLAPALAGEPAAVVQVTLFILPVPPRRR